MSRKFVSFTVLFSFLILLATSVVLYVIPGGGNPGPWSFWGLPRNQWTDLHIVSGFLFLIFGIWHMILNWRGLAGGFRKIASAGLKAAWPVLGALALNIFIAVGTLGHYQPVEMVLSLYKEFKTELRQNMASSPKPENSVDSGPMASNRLARQE